jgi:protein farnesyltransferase subunit beta
MQASAADGGGFKGRANKLVDGCYGWWVGGSFAALESLVRPMTEDQARAAVKEDAMLYDRGACLDTLPLSSLPRRPLTTPFCQLLCKSTSCCSPSTPRAVSPTSRRSASPRAQATEPALADSTFCLVVLRRADFYHTANNLSGLSLAQHRLIHSQTKTAELEASWTPEGSNGELEERRRKSFASALGWVEVDEQFLAVGGEQNRVVRPRRGLVSQSETLTLSPPSFHRIRPTLPSTFSCSASSLSSATFTASPNPRHRPRPHDHRQALIYVPDLRSRRRESHRSWTAGR